MREDRVITKRRRRGKEAEAEEQRATSYGIGHVELEER